MASYNVASNVCLVLFMGAEVVVERAGDVIPRVVGLAGRARGESGSGQGGGVLATPPMCCPACGSAVRRTPLTLASQRRNKKQKEEEAAAGAAIGRVEKAEVVAGVEAEAGASTRPLLSST